MTICGNFLLTMITSNGKTHLTIVDAAKEFGVAAKTVQDWIDKGRIPKPLVIQFGIRRIQVFPPHYMKTAKESLAAYVSKKTGVKRRIVRLVA